MSRRHTAFAALAVAFVLTVTGAVPVRAQVEGQVDTTTTAPPVTEAPTTTQAPVQPPVPEPTTVAVTPDPPLTAPPDTAPPAAVAPASPGDGDGGGDGPIDPASVGLVIENRVRTADSSTAELLAALRPLTARGFSEQEAYILGMGQFPVAGLATWSDDFHDPRYNPTPHYHQGNDIWADYGTPVRAPAAGVAELTGEIVGGISVYVTTADGTYYYMTHLSGFAPDLNTGDSVSQGEVVGFTGTSGNAAGGPAHVHFEIHPGGGGAVNPKPILDQWVADALAAASASAGGATVVGGNPRVLLATGELRRYDVPPLATAERAAIGPLLWSASVSSGGTALRLAEVEAARMAQQVDWGRRATEAQATAVGRHQAREWAVTMLSRLTPPALLPVLGGSAS
ncbi:MAG: hypothetical protein QOG43_499 [Actinomycetota bacterium]|jgi:hypothetical protein|nr:hypothetical protein [Actinomycetota bacterium]